MSHNIECPQCGADISIDAEIKKNAKEQAERYIQNSKKEMQEKEKEISIQKDALRIKELELKALVEKEVLKEKEIIEKKMLTLAEQKVKVQLKDLEAQLTENTKQLAESQDAELQLRKKMREVKEKEKSLGLEIEKKVEEATKKKEAEVWQASQEKYKLELLEKEKVIQQMKDKTDDLQKKLIEGSQQRQGEVVEEEFEKNLRLKFPVDMFTEVPKGVQGADLLQIVKNINLKQCGIIIWEFKNTKTYSKDWVAKLREDQRKANANIAVLVSKVLPKDAAEIELIDGVYVVSYDLAIPFCVSLRKSLEELHVAQLVITNKDEKMERIYQYLTGSTFKQKFKSIVNAYKTQKEQLEKEKRALTLIWAKRDKQLDIVIEAATSMFGDVEGIIGNEAPIIEELSLSHDDMLSAE